jgi:hypothetical protein
MHHKALFDRRAAPGVTSIRTSAVRWHVLGLELLERTTHSSSSFDVWQRARAWALVCVSISTLSDDEFGDLQWLGVRVRAMSNGDPRFAMVAFSCFVAMALGFVACSAAYDGPNRAGDCLSIVLPPGAAAAAFPVSNSGTAGAIGFGIVGLAAVGGAASNAAAGRGGLAGAGGAGRGGFAGSAAQVSQASAAQVIRAA